MSTNATNPTTKVFHSERVRDLLVHLDTLLSENRSPDCRLSIYLSPGNPESDFDPDARFGRMLIESVGELKSLHSDTMAVGHEKVSGLLDCVGKLARSGEADPEFRGEPLSGVAIFADEKRARIVDVPASFKTGSFLSTHWHLTPLLALGANADCYWLLLLGENSVRLFRGSRLGLRQVDFPDLTTLCAATAVARNTSASTRAVIEDETMRGRLAQSINHAIVSATADRTDPLILGGTEKLKRSFRDVSTYSHLAEESLSEDSAPSSLPEMHREAAGKLAGAFLESRKRELLNINAMFDSDRVETDLEAILPAAHEGQIAALVAPSNEICWGRWGEEAVHPSNVQKLPRNDIEGRDLYQLAAEETLEQGGQLFYLESNRMPHGHSVCAELRP